MKACLFLHRKFAPIGNVLAAHLRQYGITEFCSYVSLRSSYNFLKTQKSVVYSKLLSDEDLQKQVASEKLDIQFLKQLETKYGLPNLWPYIYIDRTLTMGIPPHDYRWNPKPPFTHEEMMKTVQVKARAIIKMLEEERPDFVFFSVIGSTAGLLLYHIANAMNIPIIKFSGTRIEQRYNLSLDYKTFNWTNEIFKQLQSGTCQSRFKKEAKDILENFRLKINNSHQKFTPNNVFKKYEKNLQFLSPKRLFRTIAWVIKISKSYLNKPKDYSDEIPLYSLYEKLIYKLRLLRGYEHLCSKPIPKEEFAFYPLNYEPEVSLLLYAPFYTDQINLVKQIARSLPVNFKLYVKEHPQMISRRPIAYYKELLKIPNVKIIYPAIPSLEFLQDAKIIFTNNGTAGWEGALLKRPVITFGDNFYNNLSFIKRCDSFEKLPFIIKEQLNNFQYNESELENFVAALIEDSIKMPNFINLWFGEDQTEEIMKQDKGLQELAKFIAQKMNLPQKRSNA